MINCEKCGKVQKYSFGNINLTDLKSKGRKARLALADFRNSYKDTLNKVSQPDEGRKYSELKQGLSLIQESFNKFEKAQNQVDRADK